MLRRRLTLSSFFYKDLFALAALHLGSQGLAQVGVYRDGLSDSILGMSGLHGELPAPQADVYFLERQGLRIDPQTGSQRG